MRKIICDKCGEEIRYGIICDKCGEEIRYGEDFILIEFRHTNGYITEEVCNTREVHRQCYEDIFNEGVLK